MTLRGISVLSSAVAVALFSGCGGDSGMMTGPTRMGAGSSGALFMSVSPQGGATGVSVDAPIMLGFGVGMGMGMEQYVDLHLGDLSGPILPMSCSWSGDRTMLTCRPRAALQPRASYALHLGGGMMSLSGQPIDYGHYGPMMGGQWIMGAMRGGSHGGSPWGMMGPGWHNTNGSYGMLFTFTTA